MHENSFFHGEYKYFLKLSLNRRSVCGTPQSGGINNAHCSHQIILPPVGYVTDDTQYIGVADYKKLST